MDINKIRQMSDLELEKYIKSLTVKNNMNCIKCNKPHSNFIVNIQNKKRMQQKKLCSLCESCYADLLDYLAIGDIRWD